MRSRIGVAVAWTFASGLLMAACTPSTPATTADAKPEEATAAAADPNAPAPVVIADAMTLPACASLPPPPPAARYVATDCRINPAGEGATSDTQLLVRFSPTAEEVQAGGRIDIEVVGADGVLRETLTEAYVFKYVYPVMSDTNGDGVAEVLIGREVSDGQITRTIWQFDKTDGRYRATGTTKTPQ